MPGPRRHGKQHVNREERDRVVLRLVALRESGEFRSQHVELAAEGMGIPTRTVWRWLRTALREGMSYRMDSSTGAGLGERLMSSSSRGVL